MELADPNAAAARRREPAPAWLWCACTALCCALALLTVPLLMPVDRVGPATDVVAAVAALAVIAFRRPSPAARWWPLGTAIAATGVLAMGASDRSFGQAGLAAGSRGASAAVWLAHLAIVASVAVALHQYNLSTRHATTAREERRTDLALDAGMIVIGVGLATWTLAFSPLLESGGRMIVEIIVFPAADLALVALAAWLYLRTRPASAPAGLLIAALGALLLADSFMLLSPGHPSGVAQAAPYAGWLLWALLLATAALYPSTTVAADAAESPAPAPTDQPSISNRHVVGLLMLSSLGPATWIFDILYGAGRHGPSIMMLGPPVLSAVLAALLVVRLAVIARRSEALHRQIVFQADHDVLTGLANRDLLRHRLAEALTTADERPFGLLLIDIDDFKNVNDTFGHRIGDEVLVLIASRLRAATGDDDLLARLGGDEFGVITTGDPQSLADTITAELRVPYQVEEAELQLTVSIGLVFTDALTSDSDTLQNADLALGAAKSAGKNRSRRYDPSLRAAYLARNELADGLRAAMARNEFKLFYQPVIELATGRVSSVEALLRWQGADGQPVSPAVFVPAAEEIGLIGQLGAWVLEQACADACRWHTEYGLSVAVNVSGHQLGDPAFADRVLATLQRSGLPAKALVLEITETVLVTATNDDTVAVSRKLARLRAHGVRIAIDDFGTGYSSFGYLRALPVDVIKIDRSFVIRVAEGSVAAPASPDRALLRALLELTSSLYMQPVAEGVETLDQAAALRELGCRYVQGFLFARPSPAETIDELLDETRAEMELPVP